MGVTIVVGGQWGDEGKGKIVDLVAETAALTIRGQGGNNAGHTVNVDDVEYKFHLIPSAILRERCTCVVGPGVVVDPAALLKEMDGLAERGIDVGRLVVSDRAQMVMPYHPLIDELTEKQRGDDRLGTTARGIGPAYADKVERIGFRIGDLEKPVFLAKKLQFVMRLKNDTLTKVFGVERLDENAILEQYLALGDRLRPHIRDTFPLVHDALARDDEVLVEGAQATMLDLDFGTYPYVTACSTSAAGMCAGAGVPPSRVRRTIGVLKSYSSRVGYGPFPTELNDATGEYLREKGREYGTTTGRARRVGWFDAVVARYAINLNGVSEIALTNLDVLDDFEHLAICTGYESKGETWDRPMANISHLKHSQTRLEHLPGWQRSIRRCRTFEDLPPACRAYVNRVAELCGVPVTLISVGPERKDTIRVR
jgi:adenylosuccinate synthase